MTEEDVLLREIRESPEDEALRLVYADWLEDHGEAERADRAEFIRLQIELARAPLDDPRRPELEFRVGGLLEDHEQAWLGPLAGRVSGWHFRCGFVEAVELEAADLLSYGDVLFAAAPIRHVRLTDLPWTRFGSRQPRDGPSLPPTVADLAGCPHLARLSTLDLGAARLTDANVETLLASPHLTRLSALDLASYQLTERSAVALARSPLAPRLSALSLAGSPVGDAGVAALAAAPLERLQALTLQGCGVGRPGLAALAGAPWLGGLTDLHLGGNDFAEADLLGLLAAPGLGRLTYLNLTGFGPGPRLGAATLRALAVHGRLDRLARLRLDGTSVPGGLLADLATSPALPALQALGLARLALAQPDLRGLLEALAWRVRRGCAGPTALALDGNPLGAGGYRTLATSPALASVVALGLRNTGARDRDVVTLAGSPYLKCLAVLDLGDTTLGLRAARELAALTTLPALSTLSLANATDPAVRWALSTSPQFPWLREVSPGAVAFNHFPLEPWWAFPTWVPFRRQGSGG